MRRPHRPRIVPTDERPPSLTTAMKAHNVRATLATNPTVAAGMAAMGRALLQEGTIAPRAREMVILRMGWLCQSLYEFGQHTLMARTVGLSDAEIELLTRPLELGAWSAADRALLEMVDDLYRDDCVSETTWAELVVHFDHHDILEYMAATLFYRMVSGILNSCGVELDEGVPGWPPGPAAFGG
jgi:4-carboxymuconolactone decarboxylase